MSDEQFHEFHLDGKQMVFLFMASSVVAVVIFLCGVMVGRGVRATREPIVEESTQAPVSELDLADPPTEGEPPPSSPEIPDDFKYSERLQGTSPPPERIRETAPASVGKGPASPPVPEEPPPVPKPETRTKPESRVKQDTEAASEGFDEPPGPGYSVQVASVPLSDAKAIRKSLIAKNYPAFITPTPTGPRLYRVRVGKYPTLKDAKAVAERLEKVEKFRDVWTVPH